MGTVVSYDDQFAMPMSEIKLDSGDHIVMTLDSQGLTVKTVGPDRILFEGSARTVAKICAGLFDDGGESIATPLRILTAAVVNMPNAAAVERAFNSAASV